MTELSRRHFMNAAATALGSLALGTTSSAQPRKPARSKLNILMIVCDQERAWKTLPAKLSLPGRQAVAARGVSFKNYQVNGVACGPSRSVIYTGQHIINTRVFDNVGPLVSLDPNRTPTIGKLLQEHGYYTAYKGKWHLSPVNRPQITDYTRELIPFGFQEWQKAPDNGGGPADGAKLDAEVTTDAVGWLQTRARTLAKEQPWFLAVNLLNPHDIMHFDATGRQNAGRLPPTRGHLIQVPDRAPYNEDLGYDLPASFPDTLGTKPHAHAAYNELCDLFAGEMPHTDQAAWRRFQNYYFNCLRDVDTQITRILAALDATGQADRTVLILTSDHGEMGSSHGMRGKGPMIYPENADVPLVIVHPDITGGATQESVAGAVDLVPTLLEFAGIGASTRAERYPFLKGYDVSPLLAAPQSKGPRNEAGNLMVFTSTGAPLAAWRRTRKSGGPEKFPEERLDMETRMFLRGFYDGSYRFGRYFSPRNHHLPVDWAALLANNDIELYDDAADPHHLNNLGNDPSAHRELIVSLNARLNALIQREVGIDDGSHMSGNVHLWHG